MKMERSLNVSKRPHIRQDESLGSYLCRVSEANYYESIITLGKYLSLIILT